MRHIRPHVAIAATVAAVVVLSGCASADEPAAPTSDLEIGAVDLSDVCPETVVVQVDWNPSSEEGHLFELLGDDYTIDTEIKSISGPLMASGEYTGVNVQIRAGGPAVGYQLVSSQMYQDDSITMGYISTDEGILVNGDAPTTAVFAPMDINPQMIMWDPATYPDVTDIASLSDALVESGGVIRYFDGAAYMAYLTGSGIVDPAAIDGSYDGTPANFVAAGGKDAQQGFVSGEPYIYETEVTDWGKPVDYQLLSDAGWKTYQGSMAVRTGDLESLTPCLTKLVPVLQQAAVDYYTAPDASIARILDAVEQYDNGWVYSKELADFAIETMISENVVGNGPNGTLGDFEPERVSKILDDSRPIFENVGKPVADDLTADYLYTNDFIDPTIAFG